MCVFAHACGCVCVRESMDVFVCGSACVGEARDFTSGEEGAKVGVNQMPVCGFEFEETETKHTFSLD